MRGEPIPDPNPYAPPGTGDDMDRTMRTEPIPDPSPQSPGVLPRVLGRFDALTVVVGSIIGSGIFLKPGLAAKELPSIGLILGVWVVMGLVTLCGSLAMAELAAMLPAAGGPYVYLREAYGKLCAFLWGWTEFWVVRTGSLGALSAATAIYLSKVAPLSRTAQEGVAIAIIVFLSVANGIGTRWGAALQNWTSVIKVSFLLGIIGLPFVLGRADPELLSPLLPEHFDSTIWKGLGLAMIAVLWPYDGWINIGPVAEEIRDPQRNVPLALGLGVSLVILLYVLANVAYHVVLPLPQVAQSEAVAADFFTRLLGENGGKIAALGVMCSTFGAVNSNLLTGPRIYFAMARDGLLPASIRRIHGRWQTPMNAIVIQGIWSIALLILAYAWKEKPGEAFDALTDFVIFGGSIFYALAVLSVIVLRFTRPDAPRPYRTWGYPLTPVIYLLAFGAALVSLLLLKWQQSLFGSLLIVVGVGFYKVWNRRDRENA